MNDEHMMRAWNESHDRFSADVTRGLGRLAGPFRRLGEWIAPTSALGMDSAFTRTAARCGIRPKKRTR